MHQFFSSSTKWCDSKHPHVQRVSKIVSSEEVKQFASIVVIMYIMYRILEALRHPVMRVYRWSRKKTTQLMKAKGPIPKVPQPCVLRRYNNKVALSRLNLPNDEEKNLTYVKKNNNQFSGPKIRPRD